ncbi:MAG: hypothetical protein WKF96_01665 [Solirubrobacteraceae bacterium]
MSAPDSYERRQRSLNMRVLDVARKRLPRTQVRLGAATVFVERVGFLFADELGDGSCRLTCGRSLVLTSTRAFGGAAGPDLKEAVNGALDELVAAVATQQRAQPAHSPEPLAVGCRLTENDNTFLVENDVLADLTSAEPLVRQLLLDSETRWTSSLPWTVTWMGSGSDAFPHPSLIIAAEDVPDVRIRLKLEELAGADNDVIEQIADA